MFYVISEKYINTKFEQDLANDLSVVYITTEPKTHNQTGVTVVKGSCGRLYKTEVYAHGAYTTLKKAKRFVQTKFGRSYEHCYLLLKLPKVVSVYRYDARIGDIFTKGLNSH